MTLIGLSRPGPARRRPGSSSIVSSAAAQALDAPRVYVALIGDQRLWVKAKLGVDGAPQSRDVLAASVLRVGAAVFVRDLRKEPQVLSLAPEGAHGVRFCAAAPLIAPDGEIFGVLGVDDTKPHKAPLEAQRSVLLDLAALAADLLVRDAEEAATRERRPSRP